MKSIFEILREAKAGVSTPPEELAAALEECANNEKELAKAMDTIDALESEVSELRQTVQKLREQQTGTVDDIDFFGEGHD